jgi:hypothetical protein
MPPRRSARVAAVAERATTALSPLPLSVVLHIFSLLPVDCRLRCAEVCRGWRSVLLERSLWTRLELTEESGVHLPYRYGGHTLNALLRCAAARAGGGLQSLHIEVDYVTPQALLAVAAANAGALEELRTYVESTHGLGFTSLVRAEALLRAAPLLRVFATDLHCEMTDVQAVRRALRDEAPFGPLRVRQLDVHLDNEDEDEAGVVAFAADVAGHASLRGLFLQYVPLSTAAALDAMVDAALARRLQSVELFSCQLLPASARALARLLGGALTSLNCSHADLLDAPGAAVLAAALRANSTLTSLTLEHAGVLQDVAAGAELLGGLTGHASLRELYIRDNIAPLADQAAVGAALGTLVVANAPALTVLDVSDCALGDDGLRALLEALPQNTHLRRLDCSYNGMSEACARDVLLPAVRANTSLRMLVIEPNFESKLEAEAVVSSRTAA